MATRKWQALGVAVASMLVLTGTVAMTPPQQLEDLKVRMALQEEFKTQQRDYNAQMDSHLTTHMDDIVRAQGQQDQRIGVLESRVSVIYGIGDLLVWAVGISVSIFFYYNTRRYREAARRHDELMKRVSDNDGRIETIEETYGARHTHRDDQDDE